MIVRDPPTFLRLLTITQGSVIPRIAPGIAVAAGLAFAVAMTDRWLMDVPQVSIAAMGIFGVALSLFLGFRNAAAYDRWWEGRTLWGQLIADARSLTRETAVFTPSQRIHTLQHLAAFIHLHRGTLRCVDATADAARWVGQAQADRLSQSPNPADAALNAIAEQLAQAENDGFARRALADRLSSMTLAQAGAERIASTPLPFVYSLLVRRTTWLYCLLLPFALIEDAGLLAPLFSAIAAYVFLGLSAVTHELEQPFGTRLNGLPLDAMCRTIEQTVSQGLGQEIPPPLSPVDHVLT